MAEARRFIWCLLVMNIATKGIHAVETVSLTSGQHVKEARQPIMSDFHLKGPPGRHALRLRGGSVNQALIDGTDKTPERFTRNSSATLVEPSKVR